MEYVGEMIHSIERILHEYNRQQICARERQQDPQYNNGSSGINSSTTYWLKTENTMYIALLTRHNLMGSENKAIILQTKQTTMKSTK